MGNSPAAARLTIVSIRTTGVINTLWAVFVAAAGTALLLHGGSAAEAMAVYLAGHVLSSALIVTVLVQRKCVPPGMISVFILGTLSAVVLAALACMRDRSPALALPLTLAMLALSAGALCALYLLGRKHHWVPSAAAVRQIFHSLKARLLPSRFLPGSAR